jgi:hypothetical protein
MEVKLQNEYIRKEKSPNFTKYNDTHEQISEKQKREIDSQAYNRNVREMDEQEFVHRYRHNC